MSRKPHERLPFLIALIVLVVVGVPRHAASQGTGMIQGVVKDAQGQPVEGAKIIVESNESVPRRFESRTGKNGDYVQVGLTSGTYKVTVEKDKIIQLQNVPVKALDATTVNFTLSPPTPPPPSPEAVAQAAQAVEMRKVFVEGIEAAQANRFDEALAKFHKTIELAPQCAECYYNLGAIYSVKERFEAAAEAVLKGNEILAAEGPNAPSPNPVALYHRGVILWKGGKYPEARKQFEQALKADPNHADSHYSLGVALIQEGNLAAGANEFETYLKLAPTGEHAERAKELAVRARSR
jgi:tetratricopeptide (TPR) repeat protein